MKSRISTAQRDALRILLDLIYKIESEKGVTTGCDRFKARLILLRTIQHVLGNDPANMDLQINFPTEYMV